MSNKLSNCFEHIEYIQKIGSSSQQGFIHYIKFTEKSLFKHLVLKSSKSIKSDNLAYEFFAGKFINHMCEFVPCFIITHSLYRYSNDKSWKKAKYTSKVKNVANSFIKNVNYICDIDESEFINTKPCYKSKMFCILIEAIPNSISMYNYVNFMDIDLHDLSCMLYLIYFSLDMFKNKFTHYDLHMDNCLLCPYDKEIRFIVEYRNGDILNFTTKYVPKIIDYGIVYFSGNEGFIDKIDCNQIKNGFDVICCQNDDIDYICPKRSNISHDLRILYEISAALKQNKMYDIHEQLLKGRIIRFTNPPYGTSESESYDDIIRNVADAHIFFKNKCIKEKSTNHESVAGTFYLYDSGQKMRWVPI